MHELNLRIAQSLHANNDRKSDIAQKLTSRLQSVIGSGEVEQKEAFAILEAVAQTLEEVSLLDRSSPGEDKVEIDELSKKVENLILQDSGYHDTSEAQTIELVPNGGTGIGVILDMHYLEVCAKQFSLKTAWDVQALETQIQQRLGNVITERILADSSPTDSKEETRDDTATPSPMKTKSKLHSRLGAHGYELKFSPNKRTPFVNNCGISVPQQGATDTCITVALFKLAGAFSSQRPVECIALVAGDSDFQPAIEFIIANVRVHVYVIATATSLRKEYIEWIRSVSVNARNFAGSVSIVELRDIFNSMAPHVLNMQQFYDRRRGCMCDGVDINTLSELVSERLKFLSCTTTSKADVHSERLVVFLQNTWLWLTDCKLRVFCDALCSLSTTQLEWLGELWLHHTDITDAGCHDLQRLIQSSSISELHISNTRITIDGVGVLKEGAIASGKYGDKHKLYINASHIFLCDVPPHILNFDGVEFKFARGSSSPGDCGQRGRGGRRGRRPGRGKRGGGKGR